jgi:hypothetical protein
MEELNAKLDAEFPEDTEKEGESVTFTPEEREEWRRTYTEFSKNGGKIEKLVRDARVKAAAEPDVYFTF